MRTLRHAVDVDGRRVTYRRAGSGPPVVLLGSVAHSSVLLVPLMRDLAAAHTVLALDPPGYGRSDPGDPDVPALARRAAAVLVALGVGPAVVVGVGTGAQVAAELAWQAPARCRAVVLDGGPVPAAVEPFVPTFDGAHVVRQWGRRRLELTFAADGSPRTTDLTDELTLELHEAVLDELDAGDRYRCSVLAAATHVPRPTRAAPAMPVVALAPAAGTPATDRPAGVVVVAARADPAARRTRIVDLVAGHATGTAPPPASVPAPGPGLASTFATTPWGQVAVRHGAPGGPVPARWSCCTPPRWPASCCCRWPGRCWPRVP